MFSAAPLPAISAGAFSVRTAVERPKLGDNDAPGKPATRRIAACWSCGRPIALKPGFRVVTGQVYSAGFAEPGSLLSAYLQYLGTDR